MSKNDDERLGSRAGEAEKMGIKALASFARELEQENEELRRHLSPRVEEEGSPLYVQTKTDLAEEGSESEGKWIGGIWKDDKIFYIDRASGTIKEGELTPEDYEVIRAILDRAEEEEV